MMAHMSTRGELDSNLVIAANPDPGSRLPYLLRIPIHGGTVFRTAGTWPREKALFCYPVGPQEWPEELEIVESVPLRSAVRRGAAIDLVLARGRENRSQLVYTKARGRDVVFWQSPRTRKQSRPNVSTPTARASGLSDLEILIDTRERYAYKFTAQQATTERLALPCGDYGVRRDGHIVGVVERKSLEDLVSSILSGKMRYLLGDLATVPRAAVVVEERYSKLFDLTYVRPAAVLDALAELQVRWPEVPVTFSQSRKLAEEWTYRYLGAVRAWAETERVITGAVRYGGTRPPSLPPGLAGTAEAGGPSPSEIRVWAREQGLAISDRGRIPAQVLRAWEQAHGGGAPDPGAPDPRT